MKHLGGQYVRGVRGNAGKEITLSGEQRMSGGLGKGGKEGGELSKGGGGKID